MKETITFGAGCFWCVEAIFQRIDGVISVVSGYSNGKMPNPTYQQVCTGLTGYAEVCQVIYDSNIVDFAYLLQVFWKTHDPTTLNRQGGDVGTQYRSGIFFHTEEQKQIAEAYKQKLGEEKVFDRPILTEITEIKDFYGGEAYHQNYFNDNRSQPYCRLVIQPKIEKYEKVFKAS